MSVRFVSGCLLSFVLVACGSDGGSGPPPPPPPPPPAPTVALVTNATEPTRLAIQTDVLYWLDGTDMPFKKLPLSGAVGPVGLFRSLPAPEVEISDGSFVYWVAGASLYRTSLGGTSTTLLDVGGGAPLGGSALALDATFVYWVSSIPQGCSPDCKFAIRRVPKTGGPGGGSEVATSANGISGITAIALAGDHVFWEEEGIGPVDSAGTIGSKIMKRSLTTGTITTVVDGRLNGLIPPPSPGFIPASWHPRGGIVADTDFVYFADADFFQSYRVMAVPVAGGTIDILLADTTHTASDFVRGMTHDDSTLHWIDENDVRSLPKSGGSVTDLAAARPHKPNSITRVGSNLYWIEAHCCLTHGKSSLYSIPTAGGTPAVVHDSIVTPVSIASDATHLVWIEGGPTAISRATPGCAPARSTGRTSSRSSKRPAADRLGPTGTRSTSRTAGRSRKCRPPAAARSAWRSVVSRSRTS